MNRKYPCKKVNVVINSNSNLNLNETTESLEDRKMRELIMEVENVKDVETVVESTNTEINGKMPFDMEEGKKFIINFLKTASDEDFLKCLLLSFEYQEKKKMDKLVEDCKVNDDIANPIIYMKE